jgi:hypothetical protein
MPSRVAVSALAAQGAATRLRSRGQPRRRTNYPDAIANRFAVSDWSAVPPRSPTLPALTSHFVMPAADRGRASGVNRF